MKDDLHEHKLLATSDTCSVLYCAHCEVVHLQFGAVTINFPERALKNISSVLDSSVQRLQHLQHRAALRIVESHQDN